MKTTKKVLISKNASALAATEGIGKADPVPKVGAPPTPKDYVASVAIRGARLQPPAGVIEAGPGAAKEIANSTTYVSDFGQSAPDASTLATNIAFAAAWSGQYTLADSWFGYVKEQTRLAWLQANPQLDDFGPAFAYALEHNAAIGTQYASTAKVFDARRQSAVKGAAVRASKKAAAKAAKKAKGGAAEEAAPTAAESNVEEAAVAAPVTQPVAAAIANGVAAKS